DAAHEELERSDRAVGGLIEAAGGPDAFLERYAVVLCSDHGQTRVERAVRLQDSFAGIPGVAVTASNRSGLSYDLPGGRARQRGPCSIADLAPLARAHFGIEPPPYARPLARAA